MTPWVAARAIRSVCNQCCDLTPRIGGKITSPTFSLARLLPVPASVRRDPEKFESLRANKDPRNPEAPGYINLFYIPPHIHLDGTDWVVDYNQLSKVLQLNDDFRIRFKI